MAAYTKGIPYVGKGDLVLIDEDRFGMIVMVDKNDFHILCMDGKVKRINRQLLVHRVTTQWERSLDCKENEIRNNDTVRVVSGPHSGQTGEIRHLYRGHAFIHTSWLSEYGGMFVIDVRHLLLEKPPHNEALGMTVDPESDVGEPSSVNDMSSMDYQFDYESDNSSEADSSPEEEEVDEFVLPGEEQEFTCRRCGFRTTTLSSLRTHNRQVHRRQIRRYWCELCNYRAKRECRLKKHKQDVHKLE